MSRRRVGAVVRRIVAQFRRDHRTLGLLFVVPVVIMLLLGWVLRGQQADVTRLVAANEAGPPGERLLAAFVEVATAGGEMELIATADTEATARALLGDRRADLAVVVEGPLGAGPPAARLVTRGVNPGEDALHLDRARSALSSAVETLLPPGLGSRMPTVEHATVFGRPDADTLDTFAPVFVGYFAYFFVFVLTGISFLRERLGGTLERLLATPVTRGDIVVGYSIGFGLFATIQVAIVLAVTLLRVDVPAVGPLPPFTVGLGVPSAGNPLLAYLIALVLGLGAVNLGIFLSTFARTELQILQFIPVVIVPQGLLGGIFWPVESLPEVLRPVARLMPVTYAVEGLREVMIAGSGIGRQVVTIDLAVLVGIAALFVYLAALTIRREVA